MTNEPQRTSAGRLRSMGHVSLVNIDDSISGAHDRVSSRATSLIERGELVASGLKCNA